MVQTVEQLFVRFREHGDANALAEVFERTAPEILRVALHFARDPAAAEDLLQATFVVAMESGAFDPERPLVPWLLGILTNQAHKRRDRDSRRPDPARLPVAEPESPSRAVEDREFSAALAKAVDSLREPYRQILVLHLRHGLVPVEIANVLGRSPGTVRSQLARALELLRRSLPVGFTATALGLLPGRGLSQVRGAVLEHAARLAPSGAGLLGAFAMKKTLLSLAGLLFLAALATLAMGQLSGPGSHAAPHRPLRPQGLATTLPRPALQSESPKGSDVLATHRDERSTLLVQPGDSETFGLVTVRLLWEDNGAPAPGIAAYVVAWEQSNRPLYQEYKLSDINGLVRYEEVFHGPITVYTMVGAHARAEVRAGQHTDVEVRVPRGITVTGVVVDYRDQPVPGAEVWLCSPGAQFRGMRVASADAWGEFEVRGLKPDSLLGARSDSHAPSGLYQVASFPADGMDARRNVRLVLPGPGFALSGRVVDDSGLPVEGAAVQINPARFLDEWGRIAMGDGAPLPRSLRTDADGGFACSDLPGGEAVVLARYPGLVPGRLEVNLQAGETPQVLLTLQPGVTVVGHVTDAAGRPIVEAHVDSGSYGYFTRYTARTDANGNYRLEGLPINPEVHAFTGSGRQVVATLTAAPGQTVRWDPVLTGGNEIAGRLLDQSGQPLAGWSVWVRGPRGQSGTADTDPDGRFTFYNRLDEEHILEIRANGARFTLPPLLTVSGVRCGDELELRVPDARLGSIVGRVFDDRDQPVQAVIRCIYGDGESIVVKGESDPEGRFVLERLPPMEYRLTIQAQGHPVLRAVATVHPGAPTNMGTLRIQQGHRIALRPKLSDGGRPTVTRVTVSAGTGPVPLVETDGLWVGYVAVGSYTLTLEGENFLPHGQLLVVDGNPGEIPIELVAARRQAFGFHLPRSVDFPFRMHLELRDDRDEVLRQETLTGDPTQPYSWAVGLAPGGYQLRVTTSTGLAGEVSFRVSAHGGPPLPVAVQLR